MAKYSAPLAATPAAQNLDLAEPPPRQRSTRRLLTPEQRELRRRRKEQDAMNAAEAEQERLDVDAAQRFSVYTDGSSKQITRRGVRQRGMSDAEAGVRVREDQAAMTRGPSTAAIPLNPNATPGAGRGRPLRETMPGNGGGMVDPYKPTGFQATGMNGRPGFQLRTEAERQARINESPLTRRVQPTPMASPAAPAAPMAATPKPATGAMPGQRDRLGSGTRIAMGKNPVTSGTMLPRAQQIRMDGAGEVGPPKALATPAPMTAPKPMKPVTPVSPNLTTRQPSAATQAARSLAGVVKVSSSPTPAAPVGVKVPPISSPRPILGAETSRAMGLPPATIDRGLGMAVKAVETGQRMAAVPPKVAMSAMTAPGRAAVKPLKAAQSAGRGIGNVFGAVRRDLGIR